MTESSRRPLMYRSFLGLFLALVMSNDLSAQFPQPEPPTPPRGAKLGGPIIMDQPIMPPSHLPELDELEVADFRNRLLGKNKKNSPNKIDPELLKKLMEKLPKDQKANPEQLEKMFQENPQLRDPAFLKQLEKLLESKDFPKNLGENFPKDQASPDFGKNLGDKLKQAIDSGNKQIEPKANNVNGEESKAVGENGEPSKPTAPEKSPYEDNEWVKWLGKNFKDSPAANDAMKDLLSSLDKNDGKGMWDGIPDFKNGDWKDFGEGGKTNSTDLLKGKPNDWNGGNLTSPKMNGGGNSGGSSWGGSAGGGGSGFGGGTGGSFEGGSTVLVVIEAIAAIFLLAILFLRKWKLAQLANTHAPGSGSSPIDIDAIHSREELVRVYDHVSLEKCGEEARAWNHRVIASQFVEVQPKHVEPANEVAELYERARYAPTDEDLTPREFSDARRDLRTIAGVSS